MGGVGSITRTRVCVCVCVCVCVHVYVYTPPAPSLTSRHEDYVVADPLLGDREVRNVSQMCYILNLSVA